MFAVIKDGGRQVNVRPGQNVLLDLKPSVEAGSELRLDQVVLVNDEKGTRVGAPLVEGAAVVATALGEEKGEKLIVFKKRRRKDSKLKRGHRQRYTAVRIDRIEG